MSIDSHRESLQDVEFLAKVAAFWKSKDTLSDRATQFGRFVIKEKLGWGGFGVVYLAFDPLIGRDVAIKFPGIESLIDESRLKRFLDEARHLGAIASPNIVEIYEANEIDGLCYLAMKYYPHGTLANWLKQQATQIALNLAESVFLDIVNGVAAAHAASIIHRDLKPSNILIEITTSNKVGMTGIKCYVSDFGLAKSVAVDRKSFSIVSHSRMGTLEYMGPEQTMHDLPATSASDVFALGAILFELLVGRPPTAYGSHNTSSSPENGLHSRSPQELLQVELEHLRLSRPDTPILLLHVIQKCLQFNPSDRYQDATELLSELLSAEPPVPSACLASSSAIPHAKPIGKILFRSTLFALLLIVLLVISWSRPWYSSGTPAESDTASSPTPTQHAYALGIQTAFARLRSDSSQMRGQAVTRALDNLQHKTMPFEAAYLNNLDDSTREFSLNFGKAHWIPCASASRDGKWLAVPGTMQDITLFQLSLPSTVKRYQGLQDNFFRLAISPGNKYVVGVSSIYKRPDRTKPQVLVWDFESSKLLFDLNDHIGLVNVFSCEFLSDDRLLISGSFREGNRIKVCSIEKCIVEAVSNLSPFPSSSLALNVFEENLQFQVTELSSSESTLPKIFVADKLEQQTFSYPLKHDAIALNLSASGKIALVDSAGDSLIEDRQFARVDSEIVVWDPRSQVELFHEHWKAETPISAITFSADEESIYIIDTQGIVHQRSLEKQSLEYSKDGLAPKETWCVSIHPSEPKVLYCGDGGSVGLLSLSTAQVTEVNEQQISDSRWQLHGEMLVTQCAWRPGCADQFATSSFDGNVRLWQLTSDTPKMLAEFPHPGRVRCIAFTPDGKRLTTGGEDHQIRVFDLNSGNQISTLAGHTAKIRSLNFLTDGRTLQSSANDAAIITWDLGNNRSRNIEQLSANPICATTSPNGKWFVFGTEAGMLGIRSLTGDSESKDIPVSKEYLRCVAITSDSQTLATGTQEGELALWNLETGIKLADFSKQPSPIVSLSFSSDNRTLVAGLYSGQLVVWSVK